VLTPLGAIKFLCEEELGGKTMISEVALTDDMRAVQRWENEGGQVSLNNLLASFKGFANEDSSRENKMLDAQKSPQHDTKGFSKFNLRRVV
jgi:hypothetical protein